MALLFCMMLSCRSSKTEVQDERYKVKGEWETAIQTEKKTDLTQNENRLQDQAENQTTEIITAEFDTLNSKPVLKKLQIQRTIANKAIHAEQQVETHASGTEKIGEGYKAKGEKEMDIHTEKKSKPVRSFSFWWIAGGIAIALLLLLGVWKKIM